MSNPAPGFGQHPNYQVRIEPSNAFIEVKVGERVVAQTDQAVQVSETKHRPVWYLPADSVDAALITPTETQTYCPFKGHAAYWQITTNDRVIEDAMWSYQHPYDECLPLKGWVSFYTNKVSLYIDGELSGSEGPGRTP